MRRETETILSKQLPTDRRPQSTFLCCLVMAVLALVFALVKSLAVDINDNTFVLPVPFITAENDQSRAH